MAGKPVGEISIALELDPTQYTAAQKKILASSVEATGSIEANWKKLGGRSDLYYEQMKQGYINSQRYIIQQDGVTKDTIIRSRELLNQQLAKLEQERLGGIKSSASATTAVMHKQIKDVEKTHSESMAAMMRDVLRFYAAYYVVSSALQYLSIPFIKGFKAVEEYNTAIASMAAMVVTFGSNVRNLSLEDQWKGALAYSTKMVPVLEKIAAKTLLSGQETIALANAFARGGVFLDENNKKQIESFTRISNALPLMTQGQEITRQINTEVRSLLTGMNEQSSMMLITLKAIDPQIEKHLAQWRAEDTVLEHIGELLKGFGPATEILEKQWQAVKTTLDTTVTQILRGAMKPAYESIIESVKELDTWLNNNKKSISDTVNEIYAIGRSLKSIYNAVPDGMLTAIGSGILIRWLFGATPVGTLLGTLVLLNVVMDKLGVGTSRIKENLSGLNQDIKNMLNGKKPTDGSVTLYWDDNSLTAQEKANLVVQKMMKQLDADIIKGHKETLAEFDKATQMQVAAFKNTGATDLFINAYIKKRYELKDQTFKISEKEAGEAKKRAKELAEATEKNADQLASSWAKYYDNKDKQAKNDTKAMEDYEKEKVKIIEKYDDQQGKNYLSFVKWRDARLKEITDNTAKEEEMANRALEVYQKIEAKHEDLAMTAHERAINRIKFELETEIKAIELAVTLKKKSREEADILIAKITTISLQQRFEQENANEKHILDMKLSYLEDMGQGYSKAYRDIAIARIRNEADKLEVEFQNANGGGMSQAQQNQLKAEQDLTLALMTEWEERLKAYADFRLGMGDVDGANNAIKAAGEIAQKKIELQNRVTKNAVAAQQTIFDKTAWVNKQILDLDTKTFIERNNKVSEGLQSMESAFTSISGMYEEGSTQQKKWTEAAKAMMIAQKAVAVVNAVAAVAASAAAPWPAGFVSMAAMLASMASLLGSIGAGIGGNASTSTPAAQPASTVLGAAAGTASESITNITSMMEEIHIEEWDELKAIKSEIEQLNRNITGLVSGIVKSYGDFSAGMIGFQNEEILSASHKAWDTFSTGATRWLKDNTNGVASFLFLGYLEIANWLGDLLGKWGNSIFGGDISTSLSASGFKIGQAIISDLQNGVNMSIQSFATIKSVKGGGWFRSDKTTYSTIYKDVDEQITNLFTKVFSSLGNLAVDLSKAFGMDVNNALNYMFADVELDFTGLTGDEINTKLNEYISGIGDTMASTLFGELVGKYQKIGEGALETVTRLALEMKSVENMLNMINVKFQGTTMELIDLSQSLIDLAGGLDVLQDQVSSYYGSFFSDSEKMMRQFQLLNKGLGDFNLSLPTTRAGFRDLVEGIDLSTEAGKQLFVTLMGYVDMADDYYSYFEEVEKKHIDLQIQLMELLGSKSEALAMSRRLELEAMDESLWGIQEAIWAIQDAEALVAEAKTNLENAFKAEKDRITEASKVETDKLNASLKETTTIVSDLESAVDKLKSARESMKMEDAEWVKNQYRLAQATLAMVLGQVRGGNFTGLSDIDKTLQTLTESNTDQYTNSLDYKRDFWKTYNSIYELENLAGDQLSIQERIVNGIENQITAIENSTDAQLLALDAQLNAILGVNTSILSIADAIGAYQAAVAGLTSAQSSGMSINEEPYVPSPSESPTTSTVTKLPDFYNNRLSGDTFYSQSNAGKSEIDNLYSLIKGTGYGDSGYYEGLMSGYLSDVYSYQDTRWALRALLRQAQIAGATLPSFAEGGISSGPDTGYVAKLHGTELIVSPKSSYPVKMKGNDNVVLIEEVRALRAEINAGNLQIAKNTLKSEKHLDFLEQEMRTDGVLTRTA